MQPVPTALRSIGRALWRAATPFTILMLIGGLGSPVRANVETTVHDFSDPSVLNDGAQPWGALIFEAQTGNLYGTTRYGGKFGKGTVFSFSPAHVVTILHSFNGIDGANPTCALILIPSSTGPATLIGTCLLGGSTSTNFGDVFHLQTTGAGFAVIHVFHGAPNDGSLPYAGVIQASDGRLYGTTLTGGRFNQGVTYRLGLGGGATFITHSFRGLTAGVAPDGARPYARLFEFKPGMVVGTTSTAGSTATNLGTVFQEALSGAAYLQIHTFTGVPDGANPTAELIQIVDPSGIPYLYGTTVNGGPMAGGTVYRLVPGGGSYSVTYGFGAPGDGAHPWAGLFFSTALTTGLVYGTTRDGGAFGTGTVVELTPASPAAEAVAHSFTPFAPPDDGDYPVAAVILNPLDGLLYGTCTLDGMFQNGTIYNITP